EGSGPTAREKIFEWIDDEDEQILLMVYSLRDISAPGFDASLVDLLGEKVDAQVPVIAITDRKQSDGYWDQTEDELRKVGVTVYEATNDTTPFTAMHHKVAILGRNNIRVITDAANWTKSGLGSGSDASSNVESTLFIEPHLDEERTARRYLAQFFRVLERYADQGADDGEPSFDETASMLFALPGWPLQKVHFVAHEGWTEWGEIIRVRGNQYELGNWGDSHLGLALTTDSYSYPTWQTVEPALLPVGTAFEWKLVAATDDDVRWEEGANRVDIAAPPTLEPTLDLELEATWR
ncbi:MAG: hypothetical protein HN348_35250, partial [Proteobacteria bacterium]|nr:hypothetical protein [Pseudomonadota bacterium]